MSQNKPIRRIAIIGTGVIGASWTSLFLAHGLDTSQSEGLALEASYFGICAATEDKKEGTSAFLEKRAPQFHGR
jgi:enoyl-CoA hydratase/carnithine racemase